MARDRPPTWKPKTQRSGQERELKLAKVRREKQSGKEKNADLLRTIQRIFSKIVFDTRLNNVRWQGYPSGRLDPWVSTKPVALIPLVMPQNRHLAYRSEHATTRTMSLWKRPPSIMCTSKHTHYAGGIE
jgi:hypothetical protein